VKIGIYDPYLDTLGGGEKYMLTIAECLSRDHDVDIFWNDAGVVRLGEKRFSLDLSKVTLVPDIFSARAGLFRRFSTTRKYDLIIYLSDGSIPTVFSKELFLHFQFPTQWIKGISPHVKVKLLRVNKLVCNSKFTKTYIEKIFQRESIVVYPPVDVEHSFTKAAKDNMILTVGRHTRPSGIDFKKHSLMIGVFKKIARTHKGWRFVVVTNNLPEDEKYVRQLRELAKGSPIDIQQDISRDSILNYYNKAKIYWHAAGFGEDLASHPELFEHFGIVTVEAMNRGAVPVVFNGGGQKEIIENGRSGYLWNTLDDCIDKTQFLMTHEKDRIKLSKQAFEDSLRFDKKKFCERISSLI
jgi:glycosyltransferase involved in cell wall biosynthesis